MQSNGARVALVVGAVAVAAVAFVVLSSSDDEDEQTAATAPAQAPAGQEGGGGEVGRGGRGGERTGNSGATVIEVEDGSPVGGVADIEVQKDDRVRLVVRSDTTDEVHVHGYDLFADVAPGKPAELRFRADVDGVYEVELEGSHTEIASLAVEP